MMREVTPAEDDKGKGKVESSRKLVELAVFVSLFLYTTSLHATGSE